MKLTKLLFTLFILSVISFSAFAQSTTITPGSVLPQMTSAQRTALANPVNGMLVFDTNTNSYWFRQNTAWVELGSSSAGFWQLNGIGGNEIKNTNSGGFWSENPVGLNESADDTSNPPTAPINGNGTRMMWIPSRSAFRVGTVTNGKKSWDADSIGLFSFAAGYNSKASGKSSIAIGYGTMTSGDYSTAMGYYSLASGDLSNATGSFSSASGDYSTAMGDRTEASGNYSTAMGYNTVASGDYSTAMGYNTEALGNHSTTMGLLTWASGSKSTAMGYGTIASGSSSTAMGVETKASGSFSTALGYATEASGSYSSTMGVVTKAKASGSLAVGRYNDDSDNPDGASSDPLDRLFQIGNGTSSSRSNAMTVLRNGYVGLMNENNPVAPLHIGNGPNSWERHIRLDYDPATDEYGNIVYDNQGMKFRTWGTGDNFYFRNNANTSVAIMYESGNMTIAGTLTQNSDARLKKDLQKISNSSSKLAGLNAYHYHWKAIDRDQNLQTGLLAQEVQEVFPELVNEGEDGYLSVNYVGLIPHLIESHKELKAENEELKKRLSFIEQKLQLGESSETASLE